MRSEWWTHEEDDEIRLSVNVDFHPAKLLHPAPAEKLQLICAAAICEAFEADDIRKEPPRLDNIRLGTPGEVNETDVRAEIVFNEQPVAFYQQLERCLLTLGAHIERKIDLK